MSGAAGGAAAGPTGENAAIVETPLGPARVLTGEPPGDPVGTLVLGHGAGGGAGAPDLVAVTRTAVAEGWRVLRIEQPWRVAGKRIAPPPARLDIGWTAVLDHLRAEGRLVAPLVLGGRSAGARVACRTAAAQHADGVLALAFPLHPPARPERSRAGELTAVGVPLLVVQGERDAFGGPEEVATALVGVPGASVYGVPGDHSLRRDVDVVAAAAFSWLDETFRATPDAGFSGGGDGGRAARSAGAVRPPPRREPRDG